MTKQVPRGDADLICPLHKQTMESVCHKCPWWYHVRGKNKNTGEDLDEWKCAVALLPLMLVETADQMRQAGAATESMRNEIVTRMDNVKPLHPGYAAISSGPSNDMKFIGHT